MLKKQWFMIKVLFRSFSSQKNFLIYCKVLLFKWRLTTKFIGHLFRLKKKRLLAVFIFFSFFHSLEFAGFVIVILPYLSQNFRYTSLFCVLTYFYISTFGKSNLIELHTIIGRRAFRILFRWGWLNDDIRNK